MRFVFLRPEICRRIPQEEKYFHFLDPKLEYDLPALQANRLNINERTNEKRLRFCPQPLI